MCTICQRKIAPEEYDDAGDSEECSADNAGAEHAAELHNTSSIHRIPLVMMAQTLVVLIALRWAWWCGLLSGWRLH